MQALIQRNQNGTQTLSKETLDTPKLANNQALVKISHVAQNPTDVQSFDRNAMGDGAVFGCDFAGTVEEVGSGVTRVAKGDKIAGLIWGGEIKGLGAYATHTVADERICFKIPPTISPAAAATVPLAACTSWLTLFSNTCLDIPRKSGAKVLIWGGSCSVGLYAIQLARKEGLQAITTCSPHNFDLVKNAGAQYVFDYASADVVDRIQEAAPDLAYVFDTIGNADSSATASQAVRAEGGVLCTVRPGKANTEKVTSRTKVTDVLVWTAFMKDHAYGTFKWPASKEDHELSAELFEKLPGWLESGDVKPNPQSVKKGLDAVREGFQEFRDGKISAYKIVYEL